MTLALLVLAALAAVVLWRRRTGDETRVVVTWQDGAETALREATPGRERLVAVAGRVLA